METSSIRRLWQVAIALIVIQVALGYWVFKLYIDKQLLSGQVVALNTQVSGLNGQLAAVSDRMTDTSQKLVALPQPPTVDAVATSVRATIAENIVDKVAKALVDTPRLRNRVKGERGEKGETGNPGPTVDEVAQKVYETYHAELRGKDGANGVSPDAAEVAKIVAGDLQFADLVAQMKNQ
jgi:hypothetical protein